MHLLYLIISSGQSVHPPYINNGDNFIANIDDLIHEYLGGMIFKEKSQIFLDIGRTRYQNV